MAMNTVHWTIGFIGECMIELVRTPAGVISLGYAGDTFNSAAYFSRIGNRFGMAAEYVSALGDDSFSQDMRAFWMEENVASPLTRTLPNSLPGLYFVDVDAKGERFFTYWRGEATVRDMLEESGGEAVLENLARYDAMYYSGISVAVLRGNGRERLLRRMAALRASGKHIFFDGNFRPRLWSGGKTPAENARPWYEFAVTVADTVFLSREECGAFGFAPDEAPETICKALLAAGVTEVVLKDGARACVIGWAGGIAYVPARAVENVVDTTAAGDSFSAAYIAGRRLGLSPEESAERAHGLAAIVVGHKGAIIPKDSMPDLFSAL